MLSEIRREKSLEKYKENKASITPSRVPKRTNLEILALVKNFPLDLQACSFYSESGL